MAVAKYHYELTIGDGSPGSCLIRVVTTEGDCGPDLTYQNVNWFLKHENNLFQRKFTETDVVPEGMTAARCLCLGPGVAPTTAVCDACDGSVSASKYRFDFQFSPITKEATDDSMAAIYQNASHSTTFTIASHLIYDQHEVFVSESGTHYYMTASVGFCGGLVFGDWIPQGVFVEVAYHYTVWPVQDPVFSFKTGVINVAYYIPVELGESVDCLSTITLPYHGAMQFESNEYDARIPHDCIPVFESSFPGSDPPIISCSVSAPASITLHPLA